MQAQAIARMNPDSPRVPKPGMGASGGPPAFGRSRKKLIDWHEILKCGADSRLQSKIPALALAKSNHLNEPRYRGSTRLPWQGKSPRVYPWREKQRSDRPPVLASLVRPQPRRADLSFRRLSCQRKRKNLQTESSCAPQSFPGWGDAVGILDPLAKSPTIFNERIDHFNGGSPRSWPGVGVF